MYSLQQTVSQKKKTPEMNPSPTLHLTYRCSFLLLIIDLYGKYGSQWFMVATSHTHTCKDFSFADFISYVINTTISWNCVNGICKELAAFLDCCMA